MVLRQGCTGVVLFGSAGEAASFDVEERMRALERVLAAGVPVKRMIVGTGCCALTDTVQLTRHTAALGCKHVLVLPPWFFHPVTDAGLFSSYASVIDSTTEHAPALVLYNHPGACRVRLSAQLVRSLAKSFPDRVAGIKDSSPDWRLMLRDAGRDLSVFVADEDALPNALRAGAAGCISATGNIDPGGLAQLYQSCSKGRVDAEGLRLRQRRIRTAVSGLPLVPALKEIRARMSGDDAWRLVRPPLQPLGQIEADRLWSDLGDVYTNTQPELVRVAL